MKNGHRKNSYMRLDKQGCKQNLSDKTNRIHRTAYSPGSEAIFESSKEVG